MKRIFFLSFSFLVFLISTREVNGQLNSTNMSSSIKSSTQIEKMPLLEKHKQEATHHTPAAPLPTVRPQPQVAQRAEYLHPGILVYLNDRWQGSDHLLNISSNIGVYVTLIKPEHEILEITDAQIQKEVEAVFSQANIKPVTLAPVGKPPLPAFEIELFVYPIERGYVACCAGRLFESVILDRFKMDPNMAFQAVTWEKQQLLVSPKAQFSEQITKTIQDTAQAFVERFQAYEKLKKNASY